MDERQQPRFTPADLLGMTQSEFEAAQKRGNEVCSDSPYPALLHTRNDVSAAVRRSTKKIQPHRTAFKGAIGAMTLSFAQKYAATNMHFPGLIETVGIHNELFPLQLMMGYALGAVISMKRAAKKADTAIHNFETERAHLIDAMRELGRGRVIEWGAVRFTEIFCKEMNARSNLAYKLHTMASYIEELNELHDIAQATSREDLDGTAASLSHVVHAMTDVLTYIREETTSALQSRFNPFARRRARAFSLFDQSSAPLYKKLCTLANHLHNAQTGLVPLPSEQGIESQAYIDHVHARSTTPFFEIHVDNTGNSPLTTITINGEVVHHGEGDPPQVVGIDLTVESKERNKKGKGRGRNKPGDSAPPSTDLPVSGPELPTSPPKDNTRSLVLPTL